MEAERLKQHESLMLSRIRVVHDLETANNPRYREILVAALKHLDDKLSACSPARKPGDKTILPTNQP
jgi:hypothetical protein